MSRAIAVIKRIVQAHQMLSIGEMGLELPDRWREIDDTP